MAQFFVREIGVTDIEFQMPYQVPDKGNAFYVSMAEATEHLLRATDVMMDELGVDEFSTLRRLESFITGHWRHRDCGAVGGQIVISPTGKVGPCHSLVGSGICFSGNVNDPEYDVFEDPVLAEWSSRIPVNMPQCEGCPFIALCGGGCPYNALTAHGTIWEKETASLPISAEAGSLDIAASVARQTYGDGGVKKDRPGARLLLVAASDHSDR